MNIQVNYLGRLGNNMFQYAFTAIVLAEMCKVENSRLYYPNSIPTTEQLERIVNKKAQFLDALVIEDHVSYAHFPVTYDITDYGDMEGKILSIDEIVSKPYGYGTTYNFNGFFQHKSYYENKRSFLKSLFNIEKNYNQVFDTAVHIRLTDYKEINWTLPESYYNDAIKMANPSRLTVFTDEPNHSYIQLLRASGASIVCGDPVDDLAFMASHKKIIISRSSYSWWAAMLSDAKIYYPRPSNGFWSLEQPHKDVAIADQNIVFVNC